MLTAAELDRLRADIILNATLAGNKWAIHTTWGLFSPRAIDEGMQLLAMAQFAPQGKIG